MNEHSPPDLPNDEALRLHQRLLARDATASTEVAVAYFQSLLTWLQRTNPAIDPHLCTEAAGQAVLNFSQNPSAYDPDKLTVAAYLRMAASGDLKNLLRKEQRHQQRRQSWNDVEDAPESGKYLGRDDDPSLPLQIAEARQPSVATRAVLAQLTELEGRVWDLMQQGEHKTSVYAALMEITELPKEEQERQVKRIKDRVARRMKRAEANHGQSS